MMFPYSPRCCRSNYQVAVIPDEFKTGISPDIKLAYLLTHCSDATETILVFVSAFKRLERNEDGNVTFVDGIPHILPANPPRQRTPKFLRRFERRVVSIVIRPAVPWRA